MRLRQKTKTNKEAYVNKIFRFSFVFVLCAVFVSGYVTGQSKETGVIQGKVTDEEGVPLPGAEVTADSPKLMGMRSAVTDDQGKFRFPALPGGTYVVIAKLAGFAAVQKTNVVLHVGMTVTVDAVLTPATLEEEVTVIGETPLIDVTDSALAKTIITADFFENIPTARNAAEILNLAPGVVNLSAHGGAWETGNSYQIDGVEVNDSWCGAGVYTTPIDYHVIEETQIVGLGAPAEYGNFTGAMINIVTKSGGNTLSGDALFSYKGEDWKSEHVDPDNPKWSLIPESPSEREMDASFHLGGPFLKDKLWFFGGFEYYYSKTTLESSGKSSPLKYPKVFGKLTFQPTERDRFQAFFQWHHRQAEEIGLAAVYDKTAQWDLRYPVYAGNLSYLHTFSSSTIFEMKFAGYTMEWHSVPHTRDADTPGHVDLVTGESWGNSSWWSLWKSNRLQASAGLSYYIDELAGSHDFKLGLNIGRSSGGGDVTLNGGFVYYDWNGAPYLAMSYAMNEWAVNWLYTLYLQDDWKLTESLTINPGIRFDMYRGYLPDYEGGEVIYKPTALEPRLGFVWDVFPSHKTVVKAHYGRYNENTKSYYISQMQPAMQDTITYLALDWEGTLVELFREREEGLFSIDPDITHPYMDQFTAGIEQIIGQDITVSASFIYRNWDKIIEPVNVNGMFAAVQYPDPETGEPHTVYNQLNPGDNHYHITNPEAGKDIGQAFQDIVLNTPDRKYTALEITLKKRFSNRWQLFASYVYSHERGSYPNSHAFGRAFNMGRSDVYYDPNYQINLLGRSSISIPHVFKLQGTVILPFDIYLSAYYLFHNGQTWSRRINVPTLAQGNREILTEEAGNRRLPSTSNLDLRLEKSFQFDRYRFRFMVDVFNVFNQARETSVRDIHGDTFGKPLYVNSPRTFRLSFRFMF